MAWVREGQSACGEGEQEHLSREQTQTTQHGFQGSLGSLQGGTGRLPASTTGRICPRASAQNVCCPAPPTLHLKFDSFSAFLNSTLHLGVCSIPAFSHFFSPLNMPTTVFLLTYSIQLASCIIDFYLPLTLHKAIFFVPL